MVGAGDVFEEEDYAIDGAVVVRKGYWNAPAREGV